jgi:hypothetical protein
MWNPPSLLLLKYQSCKEEKVMRYDGLTRTRNGQSFWKCLKWGLKNALIGKRDEAKKHIIQKMSAKKHTQKKRRHSLQRKRWSLWKTFWSGMVVLGDLPISRIQRVWNGQIVMSDPSRWKMWIFFKVVLL